MYRASCFGPSSKVHPHRCDFLSANQLVEFYGTTAFTDAVVPEAILHRKPLQLTDIICLRKVEVNHSTRGGHAYKYIAP